MTFKLSSAVASLMIFVLLFGLCFYSFQGFQDDEGYKITLNGSEDNMLESFQNLSIATSMNNTFSSVYKLKSAGGSVDILGALAGAAIGVVRGVGSLLIFPFQIGAILETYYNIPSILINSLLLIIVIFVGFKILSAYLQQDI